MPFRLSAIPWQRLFRRVVCSPTFEVVAVLAIVSVTIWVMFNSDAIYRGPHVPLILSR